MVTGGAGFIGSHICDTLVARGDDVTILDNFTTGSKKNIEHLTGRVALKKGDIRDNGLVEKLTKKVDLVVHLAAAVGVENILENPIESISTNFFGSEIVLKSALKFDKRIIIASTSEIYGKNSVQPLSEHFDRVIGAPQKLRWTYSDAKALEEATAHALYLKRNLRVTTVRLFNTVGPRQTGKYGMVLPRFISSAKSGEPLRIFGNGSQSRVFCHVFDVVRAIISLAESTKCIGEVFNIGGKEEITILALAKKVISDLKSNSEITFANYEDAYSIGFEDMERRVPDLTKISTFINWSPSLNLDTIIKDISMKFD